MEKAKGESLMQFNNQMFNPSYVNPNYYYQMQSFIESQRHTVEQNQEVAKAVKAFHDLCEAINKMDEQHQQQTYYLCLAEMANQSGWKR